MRIWDSIDAEFLRRARESRGQDRASLARRATVSALQLQQLEEGGDSAFYSPAIKLATGRQVLRRLGLELPAREPEPPLAEAPVSVSTSPAAASLSAASAPVKATVGSAQMSSELTAARLPTVGGARPGARKVWAGVAAMLMVGLGSAWVLMMREGPSSNLQLAERAASPAAAPATVPPAPAVGVTSDTAGTDRVNEAGANPASPARPVMAPAVVAAKEATVAVPVPVAVAVSGNTPAKGCVWSSVPARIDAQPRGKPDTYVHVVAERDADVCVMDGQNRVARLQLKAGEERSVYGAGPWQLSGDQLDRVNVFFRGSRVRAPETAPTTHWLLVSSHAPAAAHTP